MNNIILIFVVLIVVFLFKSDNKKSHFGGNKDQKIAIVSMIYKPKNINDWLHIHRTLGISHFYIRLENTPELVDYLSSQPDITLEVGTSNAANQYSSLIDRQIKMANQTLQLCKDDGIDWLIHIDCDEIIEGDLNEIYNLPNSIDSFWMQNYEAVYESIPKQEDTCFQAKYFKDCGKAKSGCVSYINGKSGGRVTDGVKLVGPHRFEGKKKQVKLKKVIVKHFESCDFEQYIQKYQRYQKGVKLKDIPFKYYRESILAKDDISKLKSVYKQYRVAN